MDRTKAEPICFRPKLAIRDHIDRIAGDLGMTVAQWLEALVEREVNRAAASQGASGAHDRALAL